MSNYPAWNVRLRHEWLAKPIKGRRVKHRQAKRIGLQEARERNKKPVVEEETEAAPAEPTATES